MFWSGLAAALWGGLYVVSQLAFEARIPPLTLSAARLAVGLAALLLALRSVPPLRERRLALLGLLVSATVAAQAVGTLLSGAAAASLLTLMTPPFVALLAPFALGERTRPAQWLGIALGIAGAAVVIGPAAAGNLLGDALLVTASLLWAAFTVVGGPLVRARGALPVTAAASLWALPLMAAGAAAELAAGAPLVVGPGAVVDVLYLGLGATALGWWAWYRGVERAPAAAAAVPFLLQPVVGVGLSAAIFHQRPSPGFLAGSALVAAGMLVASRR